MRKVNLRMNEQYKYDVIKKLVDTHGNKKNAAIKLNCSVRTIDRLIIRYKAEGKAGFIHKNRNRQPISTFPLEVKNKVIDLYRTKYSMDASPHLWFGTSITHLHLAIDDATGKILGAYFDTQETLNAYYKSLIKS